MNKSILLLSLLIFTSCVTRLNTAKVNSRYFDEFPLNQEITAELGDKLVLTGTELYQEAFRITGATNFSLNMISYPLNQGDEVVYKYDNKTWKIFISPLHPRWGVAQSIQRPEMIRPCFLNQTNTPIMRLIKDFEVEPTTVIAQDCSSCFKQEFIYNGRIQNSLKFIYREYVKDMARPAFNQELQYDLNDSDLIGFKGVRLKVKEATNTKITYEILNNFSK